MRTRWLVLGLCGALIWCAGCDSKSNNEAEASVYASASGPTETPGTPEPDLADQGASTDSDAASAIASADALPSGSGEEKGSNNPPRRYVDAIPGDHSEEDVLFYAKEDLDRDGEPEIVLALGDAGDDYDVVTKLYVLREVGDEIMRIGDNLASDGYMTSEVRLVGLKGMEQPVIYCHLTNGVGLDGFHLYAMSDGKPKSLVYSASGTGAGDDDLVDSDGDGMYDGYVRNRYSYDVLYYNVLSVFEWQADVGEFVPAGTTVQLDPTLPDNVNDVVYQYLSLRVIDDGHSEQIKQRLAELCADARAPSVSIPEDVWRIALFDGAMELGDHYAIDIKEKGDNATAKVTAITEEGKRSTLVFTLKADHNIWTIATVKAK